MTSRFFNIINKKPVLEKPSVLLDSALAPSNKTRIVLIPVPSIIMLNLPGMCLFIFQDSFLFESSVTIVQSLNFYIFILLPLLNTFVLINSSSRILRLFAAACGASQLLFLKIIPRILNYQDIVVNNKFFTLKRIYTAAEKVVYVQRENSEALKILGHQKIEMFAENTQSMSDFKVEVSIAVYDATINLQQVLDAQNF